MDNDPPIMLDIHAKIINVVNEPRSNVYVTGSRSY